MDGLIIRRAFENDIESVALLIAKLLEDFNTRSGSNFNIDREGLIEVTRQFVRRDNHAAFIAYDVEQKPVGIITIAEAFAIYNGGAFAVITELYVDSAIRSQGIGAQLLKAAFAFAQTKNWKKIEVGAPDKGLWPRTIDFYTANGFEEKGPKLRLVL